MPGTVIVGGAVLLVVGALVALVIALRGEDSGSAGHLLPNATSKDEMAPVQRAPDATDASPFITSGLDRLGLKKRLQWHILQAGLLLRPSELVALMCGIGFVGFTIGVFLWGPALGALLAIAAAWLPLAYVGMRKGRRKRALVNQLAEALNMIGSSLRSGYSFLRAIQVVKDEMDPPISEEFGRVLDELNVGVSHERALQHLLERCPNPDIELVVTACQIQATVGGNLAEILDTTAAMIRERVRLHGEISALTAEGRLSAGILAAMPIFLALIVSHISPGYLEPLVTTKFGLSLLGGASGTMVMGLLVIKKMLAIQI